MVNNWGRVVLDAVFPNYCFLCGLRTDNHHPFCEYCRGLLQPNAHACSRCALPLALSQDRLELWHQGATLCGQCQQYPPPYHRAYVPWIYNDALSLLIQRWKFQGQTRLTPLLANLWLAQPAPPPVPDILLPMPLHWRRQWSRGYNQSNLLCRELRKASTDISATVFEPGLTRRQKATQAQSAIDAQARKRNLQGAFTVRKPCDKLRIAVVDDVLTTGATAAAISHSLLAAGASQVDIWCLARTPAPT